MASIYLGNKCFNLEGNGIVLKFVNQRKVKILWQYQSGVLYETEGSLKPMATLEDK